MITVERLTDRNEKEWSAFVDEFVAEAYAFTLAWRDFIKNVFRYEPYYYVIRKDGLVSGILPLYLVSSVFLPRRFISVPFADMGGFFFSPRIEEADRLKAWSLIKDRLRGESGFAGGKIPPLEIRGPFLPSNRFLADHREFFPMEAYVNFVIDLRKPWAEIDAGFRRNVRRNLRRSGAALEVGIETGDYDRFVSEAYALYLRQMRRLGSPPLPIDYFKGLRRYFGKGGGLTVFTAYHRKKLAGGLFLLSFKRTIYADILVTDASCRSLFPGHRLYAASLRYAWDTKKFDTYNFNRTRRSSGVFEHKRKWGGKVEAVPYFYENNEGRRIFVDVSQGKYALMKTALRLIPVSLLKTAGFFLRREAGK